MNRLAFILSLLLFQFHGVTTAQTDSLKVNILEPQPDKIQSINDFFVSYYTNTLNLDLNQILDKTHPALFKLVPREAMLNEMEYSFNNPLFEISFESMNFEKIDKSFHIHTVDYYILSYYSALGFRFVKDKNQTQEDFDQYVATMFPLLQAQFPDQSVALVQDKISVKGNKKIILIDDPTLDGFKMLEFKTEMESFYKQILPDYVVTELFKP